MKKILAAARAVRDDLRRSEAAADEARRDRAGLPAADPGIDATIDAAAQWLGLAQDSSLSRDGGVAHSYSLNTGWTASYPETTGYIIPTLLDYAQVRQNPTPRARARRMLDWLCSIQFPEGGFPAGIIGAGPGVPVTFNTGQVLLGLAAGVREFGEAYREPMRRAADWLTSTQDPDGCWRRHPTPNCVPGEKAYETHVAWGLLEAARLEPAKPYAAAALKNVRWALGHQAPNGWFADCCLSDPTQPLTHTLGYALRGVLEAHLFFKDADLLAAARRTADGLLTALGPDGYLPGRLGPDWQGTARWACLTGTVQIAYSWLKLFELTGEKKYREAGLVANRFVRRTVNLSGPPESRGIKGSFPVNGEYGRYQYLNWAAKFFIDSNLLEKGLAKRGQL